MKDRYTYIHTIQKERGRERERERNLSLIQLCGHLGDFGLEVSGDLILATELAVQLLQAHQVITLEIATNVRVL